MKRAVFAVVVLIAACSETVQLQRQGSKCEFDDQCSQGLICKCVRRRNPDDEGPDEILAPGFCTSLANFTKCPSDAGVTDTSFDAPAPFDTAPAEVPVEASTDGEASTDVEDGG